MKPVIYYTLLFIILTLSVSGQTVTLTGKIINEKSEPVSGASVSLLNTGRATSSISTGDFLIDNLTEGKYSLQVSAINCATITKDITLNREIGTVTIQLVSSAKQLDEVVVTAQKTEEEIQNIPFSISSLSAKQVQEYRLWDSKEITAIVPNLYSADPGDGRNVTSIRGITTTSYDPAIATYIDGVNQFGLDTYIAQLFDVDRIEVLKGPQGTLYGRNAMGGVINIITKQPSNNMNGFAEVSIGNYNQQRYSLGLRAPLIKNKLFIGVAGMYDSRDGFYTNEFNNTSFDDQYSITGNYYLKYIANSKWAVTLNAKHHNIRNEGAFPLVVPVELDSAFVNPFVLNQNGITRMIDDIYNGSLSINYFGNAFNFSSQTSYQSDHRYYTQPIDGDFSPYDIVSLINNYDGWNKVQVYTQEFKFTSSASTLSRLKWTAGCYFFYQDNPVKQATHFGENGDLYGAPVNFSIFTTTEGKTNGAAAYGQLTYAISSKVDLIGGLRFDYEKKKYSILDESQMNADTSASTDFNALSPKLGIAYRVTDNNNIYASYTRGYRPGGLTQVSSDPSQPPLYPYNPEFSDNIEAGIKNNLFNNRVYLNVAGFVTYITDAQVPTFVLPEAITVIRNAGKLKSSGFEAEIAANPLKGLQLEYSFGFTDAKFTKLDLSQNGAEVDLSGKKQIFTPEVTSSLALQYSYDLGTSQQLKLVLRGEWMHLGKHYFDLSNNISQEPYDLLNTRCGIAAKNFEIMFWGRNLNDTKYISYAFDFGAIHLGDPRTYGVTLTGKF